LFVPAQKETAATSAKVTAEKYIAKRFNAQTITLVNFEQLALGAEPPFSNIERAVIDFANRLESDPDIECNGDHQPSLGWDIAFQRPGFAVSSASVDLELDEGELEPSLGWTTESQLTGIIDGEKQVDCELDNSDFEKNGNEPDINGDYIDCGFNPVTLNEVAI